MRSTARARLVSARVIERWSVVLFSSGRPDSNKRDDALVADAADPAITVFGARHLRLAGRSCELTEDVR